GLHRRRGTRDLLAARHQCGAVLQRPAIVLHVRDLDPAGAKRERELDHAADSVDVGAVHHGVYGEQQFAANDLGRECPLPGKRAAIASDVVGGRGIAVLDGDLHVVEPGLGERAKGLVRDPDRGSDKIGIETGGMGAGGDVHEVAARAGLAARQMHLQDAKPGRLAEDAYRSSSSSLASSASGFEQYGQPSGPRWVSWASRPSGLCTIAELDNATWRLIQCAGQACHGTSAVPTCGTASPGARGRPEFHFAVHAWATCRRHAAEYWTLAL